MWIATVDRAGNLRSVIEHRLVVLAATAVRRRRREHSFRIEHALALMIPGILAEDARHRIAARL